MKKIKFLNVFVIILIVMYVIHSLGNLYLLVYPLDFLKFSPEHSLNFIFVNYTQFVSFFLFLITFIGLLVVK
jgi:hypothetical protein